MKELICVGCSFLVVLFVAGCLMVVSPAFAKYVYFGGVLMIFLIGGIAHFFTVSRRTGGSNEED